MMKKKLINITLIAITFVIIECGLSFVIEAGANKEPIKVGILHSLTGSMAISEKAVVDATMLAIDEINGNGGLLGRKVKAIVADGKSDSKTFEIESQKLIVNEKVSVVFGCWTSSSRKSVKPIFERYDHLLFYPVQYEGLEQSPNIIYTGATPNQQIIPAIKWCIENIGKKFFLVGSDYIFPHVANTIAKDHITVMGGEVVGEMYLALESKDVTKLVEDISVTSPDIIFNTINGDSNIAFFAELRKAGISSKIIPTMSFSIGENEIRKLTVKNVVGDYACWNYFQTIKSEENRLFVENFKKKYGEDRPVSDPMEAAYFGVHIWAEAVKMANTDNVYLVHQYLKKQFILAPEGPIHFEPENNHMLKTVRIGKIRDDGQFEIVWKSKDLVRPIPYPAYRTKLDWHRVVLDHYKRLGRHWSAGK